MQQLNLLELMQNYEAVDRKKGLKNSQLGKFHNQPGSTLAHLAIGLYRLLPMFGLSLKTD